jgi:hypothetical protein
MLRLSHSVAFPVPNNVYHFVRDRLDADVQRWQAQRISCHVHTAETFTTITVEGEEAKSVAEAAEKVESILKGKTIMHEGQPFWSTTLTSEKKSKHVLMEVGSNFNVLLVREQHRRIVLYYGPTEYFEAVQSSVIDKLQKQSLATHVWELNEDAFQWACKGGHHEIKAALGEGQVNFDIVSEPKRIVVSGTVDGCQRVQDLLEPMRNFRHVEEAALNGSDCSICWTTAEDPLMLECGHVYCQQCFNHLCAYTTGNAGVECQGDGRCCERVVTLKELEYHLSWTAFEQLLEASVRSYIGRRPKELRYCPSPDCGYVYRVGQGHQTCAKCLERLCTDCQDKHETMTCAEFKDLKSGGYAAFDRFKRAMNIKDCPECGTPIEKVEGCNNMLCEACDVSFCWLCLESFGESTEDTYYHLQQKHGEDHW